MGTAIISFPEWHIAISDVWLHLIYYAMWFKCCTGS